MKKYQVSTTLTISVLTYVEASTPEEAIQAAQQRGVISLCHQCSSGDPDSEFITSGELDGEPDTESMVAEERDDES